MNKVCLHMIVMHVVVVHVGCLQGKKDRFGNVAWGSLLNYVDEGLLFGSTFIPSFVKSIINIIDFF